MTDVRHWAEALGMAITPLFAVGQSPLPGNHRALLDGRRASFACSVSEADSIPHDVSTNWQWSADLAHHVLVTPSEVQVRSGRDPLVRRFRRGSVEARLDEFLNFLNSQRSTLPDVVSFLVQEFREIWGTDPSVDAQHALASFLTVLCAAGEDDPSIIEDQNWRDLTARAITIGSDLVEASLTRRAIDLAIQIQSRAPFGLRLVPSLVLRHAAGRLFQEAHAVIESVQMGLFGTSAIHTTATFSASGAYFTPIPIARVLAEWALARRAPLPRSLTIADFACGSGVFLTEALRTLEAQNHTGKVRLIGRDASEQAVLMAKVSVGTIARDSSAMEIDVDISVADAFTSEWPKSDVILMNPPFRSWERMSKTEREWIGTVTRGVTAGRPDLSVGFIDQALSCLNERGVLATLLPAGVLASEKSSKWRNSLSNRATPSLIGVLGEHGLFRHALVNVGVLAVERAPQTKVVQHSPVYFVWSSAQSGAASKAIRAVRRAIVSPNSRDRSAAADGDWNVAITTVGSLREKPSWLPGSASLGALTAVLRQRIETQVKDLFHVRQGIRTGARDIFLQSKEFVKGLPKHEQRYFRDAVDTSSFVEGEIVTSDCLFMPEISWQNEDDLAQAVPEFYNRILRPSRNALAKRKFLRGERWWELARGRSWAFSGPPRLVSKRFGLFPAFGRDLDVKYAIVQANAWSPTELITRNQEDETLRNLLTMYWWLLNSRVMIALFREYCPNVAGGQLDLENKYVKHAPLPDLRRNFEAAPDLQLLASGISSRYGDRLPSLAERDQFAALAYGTDLSDWNLSGLETGG